MIPEGLPIMVFCPPTTWAGQFPQSPLSILIGMTSGHVISAGQSEIFPGVFLGGLWERKIISFL